MLSLCPVVFMLRHSIVVQRHGDSAIPCSFGGTGTTELQRIFRQGSVGVCRWADGWQKAKIDASLQNFIINCLQDSQNRPSKEPENQYPLLNLEKKNLAMTVTCNIQMLITAIALPMQC